MRSRLCHPSVQLKVEIKSEKTQIKVRDVAGKIHT